MVVEQPARVIVEAFEEEVGITTFIRITKLWRSFLVVVVLVMFLNRGEIILVILFKIICENYGNNGL
jgi:hypothetical protein